MKQMILLLCAVLMLSVVALAQDTMQQGGEMKKDTMKSDTMKSDKMAKKTMSIPGKVSDDGMMFMSDKDGKNWTVTNPEMLKGHEGKHVTLKAQCNADKNEVTVVSVKMAKGEMKDTSMNKDEMKKDEMKH